MSYRLAWLCAIAVLACQVPSYANASFEGLGPRPNGGTSDAWDVSGDGSTVVGLGFRWTAAGGMQSVGTSGHGTNYDASVVVGFNGNVSSGFQALRWTSAGGVEPLEDLPGGPTSSLAWGISGDGGTIVGKGNFVSGSSGEAVRWTSGGIQGLGDFEGGNVNSEAFAADHNGSVIVGGANQVSGSTASEAFRWTAAGGMERLGDLAGGVLSSTAVGISADSSTIVGSSSSAASGSEFEAFRWTSGGGMQGLGDLPGGVYGSRALDVSGDGSVVVGVANFPTSEAFIWDATNGMRSIKSVLEQEHGLDLTGWSLRFARGISDDGLTIAGVGINPSGQSEAWVATVPEPASLSLLAVGRLATLRRRCRPRLARCSC